MARRRYLSTNISTDPRVTKLRQIGGDFAALLYTWLIPHAGDDRSLPDDAEELMLLVIPGFRDKTAGEVQVAIDDMVAIGLLCREGGLHFPESFYRYQPYITAARKSARVSSIKEMPAQNSADQRESAQNSADSRESAQNSASSSSSSSFPFPFPSSLPVTGATSAAPAAAAETTPKGKRQTQVDAEYIDAMVGEFGSRLGGEARTREIIAEAMSHKNRSRYDDQKLYLRGWLRREYERMPTPRGSSAGTRIPSVAAQRFQGAGRTFSEVTS